MADEGHVKELRAAAKRYQLVLPPNLDAESILLELCVTTLQRMMRLRYTLFKTFGNLLFARAVDASTGLPKAADYGTIAWKTETEDSPYLVCSDTTSPKLLANFLRYGPWKIARPNLLITIVGGARNFELQPPELARLFSKGFAEAVTTAKAVVTTAGTDAGVAKLVADALAQSGSGLPVIGVAPYQKMTGWKELLDGKNGEEVSYTHLPDPGKPGASAPLNHDHTHFVLVDSGARTNWGTELHLRAEFEAAYAQMLHIPVAQLCVQGGPGTVTGLYESALTGTPIVIVAESGGCATDIYNFVIKKIALDEKYGDVTKRGTGAYQIVEVERLHREVHKGRLLSFFSLERGDTDLAAVLLRAVVNLTTNPPDAPADDPARTSISEASQRDASLSSQMHRSLARALKLAVVWDRLDVARDILERLNGMRNAYPGGAGSTPAAQEALQAAISLDRLTLVQELLNQPGADVGAIDLVQARSHRCRACAGARELCYLPYYQHLRHAYCPVTYAPTHCPQLYQQPGRFFFLSNNKLLSNGSA